MIANYNNPHYDLFNHERFSNKKNELHIVVLGNSLVRCGVPFYSDFIKKTDKNKLKIKFTRVTHSGMNSRVFTSLFDILSNNPPDILFIQSEYFYMDFSREKNMLDNYRKSVKAIYTNIKYILSRNNIKSENFSDTSCNNNKKYSIVKNHEYLLKNQYGRLSVELKNHEGNILLYKLINTLQKKSKIILLEMGRSKLANDYIGKKNQYQISKSLETLKNTLQVEVWRFPANLSLDNYTDFAHMNAKGKTTFIHWFAKKLENTLVKQ
jgi:hypothetical protein